MRSAKLLRRDPRMVERKKTGRKKARADVRHVPCYRLRRNSCFFAVQLGQAVILGHGKQSPRHITFAAMLC